MKKPEGNGFTTVINCMDGRIQLPVIDYMRSTYGQPFVDNITIAGPVRILTEGKPEKVVEAVLERLGVSVNIHGSRTIAVVAHHDCAGNPVDRETQISQLQPSIDWVRLHYPRCDVIGLWVDADWIVQDVSPD